MALELVEGVDPFWYTPEAQQGEDVEEPAAFYIRPLTQGQLHYVFPEIATDDDGLIKSISGSGINYLLKKGVTDWRNVTDGQGHAVKFSSVRLLRVDIGVQQELAGKVFDASMLAEDERKNS